MNFFTCRFLVLGILSGCFAAAGAPVGKGDAVPAISARDQHGVVYAFTNGTRFLLVAVEMGAAKAANQKLATQGAAYLEKHGASYLMDIHPMPGIARVFALPKMRKYPHRIVLMDTQGALEWVPTKPGHVSVLALTSAGRVERVSYWDPGVEPVTGLFAE